MAEFDAEQAESRHAELMRRIERIRFDIVKDLIAYNEKKVPRTADEERRQRIDMRKYLEIAADRIEDLLKGLR